MSPCFLCLPTIATALITVAISLYLIGFTAVIRSPGTPGPLLSYRSGGLTPEVNHRLSAVMNMALFDRIALLEAEHNPQIKYALEEAQRNNSSMELLFWAPLTIDGNTVLFRFVKDIGKLPTSTTSRPTACISVCRKITGTNGPRHRLS